MMIDFQVPNQHVVLYKMNSQLFLLSPVCFFLFLSFCLIDNLLSQSLDLFYIEIYSHRKQKIRKTHALLLLLFVSECFSIFDHCQEEIHL